jgi:hypothetical protein
VQYRKKILFISEAHFIKRFIQATALNIKEETGVQIDCFIVAPIDQQMFRSLSEVFDHVYVNKYPSGLVKKIPRLRVFQGIYGLRKLAKSLPEYDIVHIHYHHYYYSYFTPIIRNKTKMFFVSFFGSDFNETGTFGHKRNQKSLKYVDGVFANSETFLKQITTRYAISGNGKHTGILIQLMNSFGSFNKFLATHTKESEKKSWNFEKNVIVCGYNAAAIVRHDIIIDSLKKIEAQLAGYNVIFPMTYGDDTGERKGRVKQALSTCNFDFMILDSYLPTGKIQSLCLAADIFIHIQSVDSMSSSLLEHLVAGTVVITGKWLPYNSLIEKGIYFVEIESPHDLAGTLTSVIGNMEYHKNKCVHNKEIILDMMSWDTIKKNWYKYYELAES